MFWVILMSTMASSYDMHGVGAHWVVQQTIVWPSVSRFFDTSLVLGFLRLRVSRYLLVVRTNSATIQTDD